MLLGPVQRQIELRQTRRGELDRLPALQDGLNKLRAQEGEANETIIALAAILVLGRHLLALLL